MLRYFLEKISRGIILKRRLPIKYGKRVIYVTPEGGLRYWNPNLDNIDKMLLKVVDNFIKPNNIVWDVGTNIGYFSLTAAHNCGEQGKILSFEPDIWLCNILKKSIDANRDRQIDLMPFAVSNEIGMAQFNIAERSRATNYLVESLGSSQVGGIRQTYSVPTITLDSVLNYYDPPDFIKIDIEGAEHLALSGAKILLSTVRPKFLVEVAQENYKEVLNCFKEANYDLFDAEYLPELRNIDLNTFNIIAIPK